MRLGRSTSAGSVSVEAMTVRFSHGIHNDDGSVGFNAGAQATALDGETTYGQALSGFCARFESRWVASRRAPPSVGRARAS